MSAVEQILSVAAARSAGPVAIRNGRAVADRAVWFCACATLEDAPTWLIYETSDGVVDWCRMPDGKDVDELVDAPVVAGDHVDPADVLRWLQDEDPASTPGDEPADRAVIHAMGLKIRGLLSSRQAES